MMNGTQFAVRDDLVTQIVDVVSNQMDQQIAANVLLQKLDSQDRRQLASSIVATELARRDSDAFKNRQSGMTSAESSQLTSDILDRMFGLAHLQRLIDDTENEDIYANGCDNVWTIKTDGQKVREAPIASTDAQMVAMIQAQARRDKTEKQWNEANPFLNLRLPGGHRLNGEMSTSSRPCLTIRSHKWHISDMEAYFETGAVSESIMAFLNACVLGRVNVLISGATFAGKTTLARCMINQIPPEERLKTVEDTFELGLERFPNLHPDIIQSEARLPNSEGQGGITMDDLMVNSKRQSPSRIIVGEIRGGEMISMFDAMNSGYDGSLATVHASSSDQVIRRLELYGSLSEQRLPVEVTRRFASQAVHLIVHVARVPKLNRRCVTSIREVTGMEGDVFSTNELYARPNSASLAMPVSTPQRINEQLEDGGFDPRWLRTENAGWV